MGGAPASAQSAVMDSRTPTGNPTQRRATALQVRCLAATLALGVLAGCATPNVACSVRDDYRQTASIPRTGAVMITWSYEAQLPGKHGDTICVDGPPRQCHVRIAGEAPTFNNVCGLAVFAHETLLHGMGAQHD